jgi:hypothetical protein
MEKSVTLSVEVILRGESDAALDALEGMARDYLANEVTGVTEEADEVEGYPDDRGSFEFCDVWVEEPGPDSDVRYVAVSPPEGVGRWNGREFIPHGGTD